MLGILLGFAIPLGLPRLMHLLVADASSGYVSAGPLQSLPPRLVFLPTPTPPSVAIALAVSILFDLNEPYPLSMRLVVDANVLVAEMMRIRGRAPIADPRLEIFASERAWGEAQYEHWHRVAAFVRHNRVTSDAATAMIDRAFELVNTNVGIVSEEAYAELESLGRARIPRDPDDWHTVARALPLDAGIWTNDGDFLGCGCPTWVTETLLPELSATIA